MKHVDVIERLQRIRDFYRDTIEDYTAVEAVDMAISALIEWIKNTHPEQITCEALDLAISALEKQEQSCDTCRHGRFGDGKCDNCGVRYPNHYEAEEKS